MADYVDALVDALLAQCSNARYGWEVAALRDAATEFIDRDEHDAEGLAHDLWTMGASWPHKGKCRAEDESEYHNRCAPCAEGITRAASAALVACSSGSQTEGAHHEV